MNPYGLYDIDRKIRPVGEAFKHHAERWRDIRGTESRGLDAPIKTPGSS